MTVIIKVDTGILDTLMNRRSNMNLSLCLLVTLMKQHLDMRTYKVGKQKRQ